MNKIYRNLFIVFTLVFLVISCSKAESNTTTAAPAPASTVSEPVASEPKVAEEPTASVNELVSLTDSSNDDVISIVQGEKMPDFSFVDYNGNEHNLYAILEEKDCVLINLFATWCGPCRKEFPAMTESYEDYKDRVEIIALSTEPDDSFEVLADYAKELNLPFLVGRDELDFFGILMEPGNPTTIVIDKFGYVSLIETGTKVSRGYFDNLFEYYLSDYYTETEVLDKFPEVIVKEPLLAVEDLAAALDVNSERIKLQNPNSNKVWPMTITEYNGQTVLAPTNQVLGTYSEVKAIINGEINEGFSISCAIPAANEDVNGQISVDGEVVKYFINSEDFVTFTYQFERSGEHEVSITAWHNMLQLLMAEPSSGNLVYFDSLKYLSEEETIEGLKNNINYPTGENFEFKISEDISLKEIYLIGFSSEVDTYYLVENDTIEFDINVGEYMAPERLSLIVWDFATSNYFGNSLVKYYKDGTYSFTYNMPPEGNFGFIVFTIVDNMNDLFVFVRLNIFNSEESLNKYAEDLTLTTGTYVNWEYKDKNLVKTTKMKDMNEILSNIEEEIPSEVTYSVRYVDQNGNPVAGAMLQVCDDNICQVFVSDDNGVCTFTLPPYGYELHTLSVPNGYVLNTEVYIAEELGGDLTITIVKE